MSQNATVNVEVKLGVNKFHVDEGHPHIILAANPDINEFRKLVKDHLLRRWLFRMPPIRGANVIFRFLL